MPKHDYILNEIDIVYRPVKTLSRRPVVTSPDMAYKLFRENWDSMKIGIVEEFKIMLLTRANQVLGIAPVFRGGISGTVVDPKVIFAIALKSGASGIIMAHNHPSGNLEPSEADLAMGRKIGDIGELLSINLVDNLILSGINKTYNSILDTMSF